VTDNQQQNAGNYDGAYSHETKWQYVDKKAIHSCFSDERLGTNQNQC
jgi:hypothetical protein